MGGGEWILSVIAQFAMLTHTFKSVFNNSSYDGLGGSYSGVYGDLQEIFRGGYTLTLNAGVYLCAIGLGVSFLILQWNSSKPDIVKEEKERLQRNAGVAILIFSVMEIVSLVYGMAI